MIKIGLTLNHLERHSKAEVVVSQKGCGGGGSIGTKAILDEGFEVVSNCIPPPLLDTTVCAFECLQIDTKQVFTSSLSLSHTGKRSGKARADKDVER
ncbi:hypothetical protein L6452_05513 [Arctium lappa]|uniref:Uncharacterized protein n=1 Tax=Arctium lappa TaxID=4217 RepID=A0ACB9EGM8_ARCLA|nr:hypothetical protein L6452_05513 [Arctium lappa]